MPPCYDEKMARPKVSFESTDHIDELYDWYKQYRQPRPVTRSFYRLINHLYAPEVHFSNGAHDQYNDFRRDGTVQIFAFNHLTNHSDQYVATAIAQQTIPEDVGNTRVLAKDTIFHGVKRPFVDMMGAIPVARRKDHVIVHHGEQLDPEEEAAILAERERLTLHATERMAETSRDLAVMGQNIAAFVEKSYNKVDPLRVQKLYPGFARIGIGATQQGADVVVTPIGFTMGETISELDPKHAVAVIGESIPITPQSTEDELLIMTGLNLQDAVNQANDIRRSRDTA